MAENGNKGKLEEPFFTGAALIRRNLLAAGDRIVAINGQNLLHLRNEDALKMLQSLSDTIELVLSQAASRKNTTSRKNHEQPAENNNLNDIRFDVSSEADTSSMTNKWLVQRTTDVASVQNTSSAYSSTSSSAMGNRNANSLYMADFVDNDALKSASMLLSQQDESPSFYLIVDKAS
ncbi:uncharacterized protein [Bombus flavifrons]|uniref:uncharacterized protein n=1 Tax=Bombus flavifrons TaxID=103934 RepID=UPI003704280D